MSATTQTTEELRNQFETAKNNLPTDELKRLAKRMEQMGGLPDFQLALNPELESLQALFEQIESAEQRETNARMRA